MTMTTPDLLTLAEARAALPLPASDTSKDADLMDIYIPAASSAVEQIIGPVIIREFTRNFDGGTCQIVLPHRNVLIVSQVIDLGTELEESEYVLDVVTGILTKGFVNSPMPFFYGIKSVTVTWTAGIAADISDVAPAIKLATRIILAHLWRADQQGHRPTPAAEVGVFTSPAGFAIPHRAAQLLSPWAHPAEIG